MRLAFAITRRWPDVLSNAVEPGWVATKMGGQSGLKNSLAGLRFHDLRHTCITKLAEGQASEQTIMAIAGHVSRKMLEHYSHIRMEAKRAALDSIAQPLNPAVFQAGSHQIPHQVEDGQNQQVANSLN